MPMTVIHRWKVRGLGNQSCRCLIVLMFTAWFTNFSAAQSDTITWQILQQLEYKEAPHKDYGTVYLPEFSARIKKLSNKKVVIKGYLVPVDKTTWALSQNTYAACFFCGKAGPETVIGLTFKENPGTLKMDSQAVLKGTLIVNGTDVEDWMYSMRDVEILSIRK